MVLPCSQSTPFHARIEKSAEWNGVALKGCFCGECVNVPSGSMGVVGGVESNTRYQSKADSRCAAGAVDGRSAEIE